MANYPATPSLGGPFNYNAQYPPPPPQAPYNLNHQPQYPQPPYAQHRFTMYPQQAPQMQQMQQMQQIPQMQQQYANANAYNHNAHFPHPNTPNNGGPPPPQMYYGYGQFQAGPVPTPFPPMPMHQPNYTVPPHAAVPLIRVPSPAIVQPNTTLPPKPMAVLPASITKATVLTGIPPSNSLVVHSPDREDGEVSDMEVRTASNGTGSSASDHLTELRVNMNGKANMTTNPALATGRILQGEFTESVQLPASGTNSERFQDQDSNLELPSPSQTPHGNTQNLQQFPSSSAYLPKGNSKMQADPVANSADVNPADAHDLASSSNSAIRHSGGLKKPNNTINEQKSHSNRPVLDIGNTKSNKTLVYAYNEDVRTKAKTALQDLQDHQIGYENLVAEGLDEALLRALYLEIGVEVSPVNPQLAPLHGIQNSHALSPGNSNDNSLQNMSSTSISAPPASNPTNTQSSLSPSHNGALNGRGQPQIDDNSYGISTSILQQTKPETVLLHKKPLMTAADKALDRKDYIAKMLAAKANKNSASGQKQAKVVVLPPKPKVNMADAQGLESTKTTDTSINHLTPKEIEAPGLKKLDSTDKTQTELIRQRLEALKSQGQKASARNQDKTGKPVRHYASQASPKPSKSTAVPDASQTYSEPQAQLQSALPDMSSKGLQPSPRLITTSLPLTEQQQYTPSNPFFASFTPRPSGLPGLSSSTTSLPGLFGTQHVSSNPDEESSINLVAAAVPLSQSPVASIPPSPVLQVAHHYTSAPKANLTVRTHPLFKADDPIPFSAIPESRKRARAADFIDSPVENAKKRLSSRDRKELVIDVSDGEGSENDTQEADESQQAGTERDKAMSNKSHPASDVSATKARILALSNSSTETPPLLTGSAPVKDLAQAEREIKILNKKILDLQKKKALKSASRAQTPKIPAAGSLSDTALQRSSPIPNDSLSIGLAQGKQAIIATAGQRELQDSLADAEIVMEKNLAADKHLQAVVRAKADKEQQEAAKASTNEEKVERLARKASLEAALPKLDAQIEVARSKLDDVRNHQRELEAEIQRGSEGRQSMIEELEALLHALENETSEREERTGSIADENPASQVIHRALSDVNGRSRGTESRYDSSPFQVISVEQYSQSPVGTGQRSSREQSVEENMDISSAEEGELSDSGRAEPDIETEDDSKSEEYEPRLDNEAAYGRSLDAPIVFDTSDDEMDDFVPQSTQPATELVELFTSHFDRVDEQNQGNDNTMHEEREISDGPEGEDGIEDYEPPEPTGPAEPTNSEAAFEPVRVLKPVAQFEPTERFEQAGSRSSKQGPDEWKLYIPEINPVDTISISQDPVPTESLSPKAPSPPRSDFPQKLLTTELNKEVNRTDATNDRPAKPSYFTPYASPLKMFSSYRYHPEYVADVSGGYRSLTYSHNINPREFVCPHELASGICHDSACDYQHLKDIQLTDNQILQELSSACEGGTLDEQSAFVNGLKDRLGSMRVRNVNDFQSIASEIIAYRAKVLGDKSRVLTNL